MITRANWNNSLRGEFGFRLYNEVKSNEHLIVLTADLGMGLFDDLQRDLPKQFYNVGASEQALLDISVGLALEGKVPVVYSITPFLIYRGFETIRTYINHEKIPVKLIGSGRDDDYKHDGFSHDASDIDTLFKDESDYECDYTPFFKNIKSYWPDSNDELSTMMSDVLYNGKPCFLSLKR